MARTSIDWNEDKSIAQTIAQIRDIDLPTDWYLANPPLLLPLFSLEDSISASILQYPVRKGN
jgi:hypothetical protein